MYTVKTAGHTTTASNLEHAENLFWDYMALEGFATVTDNMGNVIMDANWGQY